MISFLSSVIPTVPSPSASSFANPSSMASCPVIQHSCSSIFSRSPTVLPVLSAYSFTTAFLPASSPFTSLSSRCRSYLPYTTHEGSCIMTWLPLNTFRVFPDRKIATAADAHNASAMVVISASSSFSLFAIAIPAYRSPPTELIRSVILLFVLYFSSSPRKSFSQM